MPSNVLFCAAIAFAVSLALTWWIRRVAIRHGILDQPNARSSHAIPVPRGGGLAIAAAASLVIAGGAIAGMIDLPLCLALLLGGLPVAWIGFLDDRKSVSVRARLSVHTLSATWVIFILGGLPPLAIGDRLVDLGLAGDVLGVIAIIWTLNLFNFMDGIDGIAASEAVFVTTAGGVLFHVAVPTLALPAAALSVAGASAGFLWWNWPPARIFMGDVGSGYLGFVIAALALAAGRESPAALIVWLLLGAVFFADASVTLLRRLARGERIYEAHRSHAYQVLSRRWQAHKPVTVTVIAINVLLLLPLAWVATAFSSAAAWIAIGILGLLALVTFILGGPGHQAQ